MAILHDYEMFVEYYEYFAGCWIISLFIQTDTALQQLP